LYAAVVGFMGFAITVGIYHSATASGLSVWNLGHALGFCIGLGFIFMAYQATAGILLSIYEVITHNASPPFWLEVIVWPAAWAAHGTTSPHD
jgi:predicted membrane metal-binding protein